jgi:hypothetical protein
MKRAGLRGCVSFPRKEPTRRDDMATGFYSIILDTKFITISLSEFNFTV